MHFLCQNKPHCGSSKVLKQIVYLTRRMGMHCMSFVLIERPIVMTRESGESCQAVSVGEALALSFVGKNVQKHHNIHGEIPEQNHNVPYFVVAKIGRPWIRFFGVEDNGAARVEQAR